MTKAIINADGKILTYGSFVHVKKGDCVEIIDEDAQQFTIRFLKGKHKDREGKVYKQFIDLQPSS